MYGKLSHCLGSDHEISWQVSLVTDPAERAAFCAAAGAEEEEVRRPSRRATLLFLTGISPMFPRFYHHDKNRRRNGQTRRRISAAASVLIMKYTEY
eukprot:COSAG01_NODE_23_length_37704_cov_30.005877_20_plen_96_part_00